MERAERQEFSKLGGKALNLGITSAACWVAFTVENNRPEATNRPRTRHGSHQLFFSPVLLLQFFNLLN
jgi:hypothetical protein